MKNKVYTKSVRGDIISPLTIFKQYVGEDIGFLLESAEDGNTRYSYIGKNPKYILKTNSDEEVFKTIDQYMNNYKVENTSNLTFTGGFVGFIGYEIAKQYLNIKELDLNKLDIPDAHMMFVTDFIAYDHVDKKIIFVVNEKNTKKGEEIAKEKIKVMEKELGTSDKSFNPKKIFIKEGKPNMSKDEFISKVNEIKKLINNGLVEQVVLSQRWEVETNISSLELYKTLKDINPSPYLFYINFDNYKLIGSSPEMLVKVSGEEITTCPIAGTRKRGAGKLEDEILSRDLLKDKKEIKEHEILLNLAKEDMCKVSNEEDVRIKNYLEIKKYSHVMHMASEVVGKRKNGVGNIDILKAFLPAGTLTGYPRKEAMNTIEELEGDCRGFYGGIVGYIGTNGDMDMGIGIRTMIKIDEKIYVQAGAGIVSESVAENEYEECKMKAEALIKTIYIEGGL